MMKKTHLKGLTRPKNVNKKAPSVPPRGCHLAYFRQT